MRASRQRVAEVVSFPPIRDNRVEPVDWDARSRAFEHALLSAARRDRSLEKMGA